MTDINLDYLAAKYGQKIFDNNDQKNKTKNSIEKALGILSENGVYAMFLWLTENKEGKDKIAKQLYALLKCNELKILENADLESVNEKINKNLDILIFTKKIMEQCLIYARHYAKTLQNA